MQGVLKASAGERSLSETVVEKLMKDRRGTKGRADKQGTSLIPSVNSGNLVAWQQQGLQTDPWHLLQKYLCCRGSGEVSVCAARLPAAPGAPGATTFEPKRAVTPSLSLKRVLGAEGPAWGCQSGDRLAGGAHAPPRTVL